MKNSTISLCIFLLLLCTSSRAQNPNGVWLFGANNATKAQLIDLKNKYGVTGVFMTIAWSSIQPTSFTFFWNTFDKRLDTINAAGLKIDVQIWTGPDCPSWLFNSVDTFHTDDDPSVIYPWYKDPDYITAWRKMVKTVINHISNKSYANNVLIYESAEGTTGDLTPYKGDPFNPAYVITGADWATYVEDSWHYTDSLIQNVLNTSSQVTHLMVNAGSGGQIWPYSEVNYKVPGAFSWLTTNLPIPGGKLLTKGISINRIIRSLLKIVSGI